MCIIVHLFSEQLRNSLVSLATTHTLEVHLLGDQVAQNASSGNGTTKRSAYVKLYIRGAAAPSVKNIAACAAPLRGRVVHQYHCIVYNFLVRNVVNPTLTYFNHPQVITMFVADC